MLFSNTPINTDAVVYECPDCSQNINNVQVLAQAIYFEARSEPKAGQIAVGYVIMNRLRSDEFPKTVYDVVTEDGNPGKKNCQFSYTCDNKTDVITDYPAWEDAKENAALVYYGKVSDPTYGSKFYKNSAISKQKWKKDTVVAIGNHTFYR